MPDTSRTEKISLEGCKVYGPYLRPDGRQHVIIYNSQTNKRKTVSYPKYLLQYVQNIEFEKDDTADHIDENFKNDDFNNLQKLTREENIRKSMMQEHRKAKTARYICPICTKSFEQFDRQVKHNQGMKGGVGPFCSRHCSGINNQRSQMEKRNARLAQLVEATDLSSVKFQFESESGHQTYFEIENYPLPKD